MRPDSPRHRKIKSHQVQHTRPWRKDCNRRSVVPRKEAQSSNCSKLFTLVLFMLSSISVSLVFVLSKQLRFRYPTPEIDNMILMLRILTMSRTANSCKSSRARVCLPTKKEHLSTLSLVLNKSIQRILGGYKTAQHL